jgi:hypothetical protein
MAPATANQIRQLLNALGDLTTAQMQSLLGCGDFLKAIADGRLTREMLVSVFKIEPPDASLTGEPADPSAPLCEPVRASVSFAPQTIAALRRLKGLLPSVSKTDIIGRAVVTYLFLQEELEQGGQFFVRGPDGLFQAVRIG